MGISTENNIAEQIKSHMKKLHDEAFVVEVEVLEGGKMPTKAHPSDAGFDVYATEDITLYPGQVKKTPLNLKLKLPDSTWAEITTKSGLGSKGQLVYAGVIDQAYRGVPHVIMTNVNLISHVDEDGYPIMRTDPIVIKKGEKVAQLIMNPFSSNYRLVQVDEIDCDTDRGIGGFGSSGS